MQYTALRDNILSDAKNHMPTEAALKLGQKINLIELGSSHGKGTTIQKTAN